MKTKRLSKFIPRLHNANLKSYSLSCNVGIEIHISSDDRIEGVDERKAPVDPFRLFVFSVRTTYPS